MQNMTFDQVVLKVVSASARFWDRGARCSVVRLYVLEQPGDELQRSLRTFTGSLKQGQLRICSVRKSHAV